MTSQQERIALRSGLEDLLGPDRTATLWSMLQLRDDLATKSDVASARDDLRGEMVSLRDELRGEMVSLRNELRGEMASLRDELRGEMASLRGDVRGEIAELRSDMNRFVRTFIGVQAGTVVGVAGIVVALLQFL